MPSTQQLLQWTQWCGYGTLAIALLTLVAWFAQWGFKFRLVGVTGFMGVLTVGLFGLSLGLYSRPAIEGAVKFVRVYDTGGNQVVISVPNSVTESTLDATLRQAAADLFSSGRLAGQDGTLTIRARTVVHPQPGVSQPLYLGQVQRSLSLRDDPNMAVQLYPGQVAQLAGLQAANPS
jgi:hypothetical protein